MSERAGLGFCLIGEAFGFVIISITFNLTGVTIGKYVDWLTIEAINSSELTITVEDNEMYYTDDGKLMKR